MSGVVLVAGIVGCGNIAGAYADDLSRFAEVDLRGVTDVDPERARAFAAKYGVRAYGSVAELLADPEIEVVVNLTSHHAHHEVSRRALEAGKHVHSEKPLAMTAREATDLVELAREKGLRLGCSPATFMGEAQQTVMKWVREGRIGTVRVVYAEANWGRIEAWHPAPSGFYEAGALFDVGVYPLTIATAMFGPARRVTAFGTVVHPHRRTADGTEFTVTTPDWVTAAVELADGVVLRLTATFYVPGSSRQRGMEFHGDDGSLVIDSWQDFDTPITWTRFGEGEPVPVAPVREPHPGIEFGRAVQDLAHALAEDRPHRATGTHAAHVVEILDAVRRSYRNRTAVEVTSAFDAPTAMEWAR
jgi:predicted dehydrogenase